jgi:hypothetical protein
LIPLGKFQFARRRFRAVEGCSRAKQRRQIGRILPDGRIDRARYRREFRLRDPSSRAAAFELSLSRQTGANMAAQLNARRTMGGVFMGYKIVATRGDEVLRSERESLLIAAAKARVWARVGWHVVVTDPDGKTLDPAEFEKLFAPPDPRRARLREVSARLRLAASA